MEKVFNSRYSFFTITLPLILWTILMISVSSIPGKQLPEVGLWNFDKLAHSFEFFVFSLLFFRYLFNKKMLTPGRAVLWCLVVGILYGGLDELHQMLIPNRLCAWQDFLADSLGVVVGSCTALWFYTRKRKPGV